MENVLYENENSSQLKFLVTEYKRHLDTINKNLHKYHNQRLPRQFQDPKMKGGENNMENIFEYKIFEAVEVFDNLDNIENIVYPGTFGMIACCRG